MTIVPEAFWFGVAGAFIFGIFASSARFQQWATRLVHKNRKK